MNLFKRTILCLLWPVFCSAQADFAPVGAQWTYDYYDAWHEGYQTLTVTGDTLINGLACRRIAWEQYFSSISGAGTGANYLQRGERFIYPGADSVFYYDAVQDTLLLLFPRKLSVGDRFAVPYPSTHALYGLVPAMETSVIGLDSMQVSIHGRDTIWERLELRTNCGLTDVGVFSPKYFTNEIGPLFFLLNNELECDYPEYVHNWALRCYEDDYRRIVFDTTSCIPFLPKGDPDYQALLSYDKRWITADSLSDGYTPDKSQYLLVGGKTTSLDGLRYQLLGQYLTTPYERIELVGAIREAQQVITFREKREQGFGSVDTLYDFNLKKNEIWRTHINDNGTRLAYYVDRIDSVRTDEGLLRKRYTLASTSDEVVDATTQGEYATTWIEGVGDPVYGILGAACGLGPGSACTKRLLCLWGGDQLLYATEFGVDCDVPTQTLKWPEALDLYVYPNPTQDYINVQGAALEQQSGADLRLRLYSMDGKELLRRSYPAPVVSGRLSLPTGTLGSGAFLLSIEKGTRQYRTIVVVE